MNNLKYPISDAYNKSIELLCNELFTNQENGLNEKEVKERLAEFGKNSIKEKKGESTIRIFLNQFYGPFQLMLAIAVSLSFYFREWLDGVAILVVIFINAIIGFFMEYNAERSMEALKKLTKVNAKVFRNGELFEILSEDLVPGDILYAEAGDVILADARIINPSQLQVDESALTGESLPVEKQNKTLDAIIPLAERVNMLYNGTYITKGTVKALVTATGMQTELGKIADLVQGAKQIATPLEKKIQQFSKTILWITVALIVIIFIAGVLEGDDIFAMLQTSIALAVAAIPEGLPIVATLALAQGMLRMAKYNVIVKKLSSVETLGGTNVICTDKTGTLTQNKIEVSKMTTANEDIMYRIAVLCNTASLNAEGKEIGDPLETGLLKFAVKKGIKLDEWKKNYPVTNEEPFSSETKIMAAKCKTEKGFSVYAKGAVEELIKRCSYVLEKDGEIELNEKNKKEWLDKLEEMASSGLRVIGGAYKNSSENEKELSQKLVFAGLFGMIDPPREEVFAAIKECKSAGISIKMITGDHPSTAKNVALQLGIISEEDDNVMIGKDMNDYASLSEEEKSKWMNTSVFARVTPKQKLDLVSVIQERKFIVGMTGDGINDAPALKKADIGIAMGQRGTQVAQEVSAMILKDDSFSSIVLAVKQGRIIFENIRKFVIYLVSCNLSELIIISFSSVMNLHYALFPLQILYINLVTDVLPALALGVTEGSDSIMKLPPNKSNEPIVDKKRWKSIIVYAIVIAFCSLGAVLATHLTIHKTEKWNPELCNNILFMTLILCQSFHVFNMTTDNSVPFYKSDVFRNKYVWFALGSCLILTMGAYLIPPLAKVLSLYRPSGSDFLIMFGFSLLSMVLIQILKKTKIIM